MGKIKVGAASPNLEISLKKAIDPKTITAWACIDRRCPENFLGFAKTEMGCVFYFLKEHQCLPAHAAHKSKAVSPTLLRSLGPVVQGFPW